MNVLYSNTSLNYNIRVVEDDHIRYLRFGKDFEDMSFNQSAIDLKNLRQHFFDFTLLFMYNLRFNPNPKKVLIIGLGGGTIARELKHYIPKIKIDIIEISSEIFKLSKKYFFFTEKIGKVIIGDALNLISSYKNEYDFIIVDAFNNDYIPTYLTSFNFISKIKTALKDSGVASFNTCNKHYSFRNHLTNISSIFKDVYYAIGPRNPNTTLLYALNGLSNSIYNMSLPKEYYPEIKIERIIY